MGLDLLRLLLLSVMLVLEDALDGGNLVARVLAIVVLLVVIIIHVVGDSNVLIVFLLFVYFVDVITRVLLIKDFLLVS